MTQPNITSLSFLTAGNFLDDDPYPGLEDVLRLFEYGEQIGYDGAWVRQRHLEHGVGAATVFLAAATQRTERIELGTGVIPIGFENPFRLAEDLTLTDVLSRQRLQVGVSAAAPHADLIGDLAFDGDWQNYDLGYGRIERLIRNLRSEYIGDESTVIQSPGNVQRPRVQPVDPDLVNRIWYGGGSLRSIRWAADHGLSLLTGNVISGENTDDFVAAQIAQINEYRRLIGPDRPGRIALGRVIVPLDSADALTCAKYREYAASRHERTLTPQGEKRTLFARDLVGTSEQIGTELVMALGVIGKEKQGGIKLCALQVIIFPVK